LREDTRKKARSDQEQHTNADISIGGPIALWVGLVAVAAIVQLFVFPAVQSTIVSPALAYLNALAAYALYVPGAFVLPILAALWIGSRAGSSGGTINTIAYRGMINAVYASVVYLIEIFIFYIISSSTHTSVLSSVALGGFIEYVVAIPIIVCLVVAPLFAIISHARKY
jgi:hypothetical protein